MHEWKLIYEEYRPEQQGLREAICALGNGYFCCRSAFPWAEADDIHYPGTYLAGGYNRLTTNIAGRDIVNEDLVNFPNPLSLTFRLPGMDWFRMMAVEILEFRQELDMQHGILTLNMRVKDKQDRITRINTRRFVHMGNAHLCGQELTIQPENWSGKIDIRATLDGQVINAGVKRYRQLSSSHLIPLIAEGFTGEINGEQMIHLAVETNQSRLRTGQAARTRLFRGDQRLPVVSNVSAGASYVEQVFSVDVSETEPVTAEMLSAFHSSKDVAISEPDIAAREAVDQAPDFNGCLPVHMAAWKLIWSRFDLAIEGVDDSVTEVQMILRLHIFHLLQTMSPKTIDLDVGVPARGWHGEAYRGHVFWDELYILPFVDVRLAPLSAAMIRYRYNRLPAARLAAQRAGLRGAMYPWQSGSDGREESQVMHLNPRSGRWVPDNTYIQRHVGLAIAYNAWKHYEVTGDGHFLEIYGAEMILEVARYFDSLAVFNRERNRYEIRNVMGPDEYHTAYPDREDEPGLDNNAYTNVMVAWLMTTAKKVLSILDPTHRRELIDKIMLEEDEIKRWEDMSRRMFVPFHGDDIISQFEGYENLQEFDWEGYRAKYGDIQRLDRILEAEGDSANRYKLSKQADVLMLFYLFAQPQLQRLMESLDYTFTAEMWDRNLDYYLARTSNGSTLSYVVHSWVMARTRPAEAWSGFVHALHSDVGDIQGGTTAEGIHLGAMAGTVDLAQRCFTGCDIRDGALHFDPLLPDKIRRLNLRLRFMGNWLDITVSHEELNITVDASWARPAPIVVRGESHQLKPGKSYTFSLKEVAAAAAS